MKGAIRLGAVGYLNARPLVFGLQHSGRFALRFDLPSECARLLQAGDIDVGLIPSIEYLRDDSYRIVPDVAIASRGPVASVALYTSRPASEIRSIAADTSSRTSVALVRVLCARLFRIDPLIEPHEPDLRAMLGRSDAALLIGDKALLSGGDAGPTTFGGPVEKIDLGEAWTSMTGLPFVWAFWTGRPDALGPSDVRTLQQARDGGVERPEAIAREYFSAAPEHRAMAARYLQDNIKYDLGADERAGLETFFRYAADLGVVPAARALRFYP